MEAMTAEGNTSRPGNHGPEGVEGKTGPRSKAITVLIVDDERTFGEALELALAREKDFRIVHVATDATQAIRAASEHQPDVVLMDVAMPGMNGIEATRRIKEADPKAAVLILSGHEDEHLLARAVAAGAVGMLQKTEAIVNVATSVRRAHRGEPLQEEISTLLGVTPNTLRTHVQNVLTKLAVHSKVEALALAIRFGKVDTVNVTDPPERAERTS